MFIIGLVVVDDDVAVETFGFVVLFIWSIPLLVVVLLLLLLLSCSVSRDISLPNIQLVGHVICNKSDTFIIVSKMFLDAFFEILIVTLLLLLLVIGSFSIDSFLIKLFSFLVKFIIGLLTWTYSKSLVSFFK